MSIQWYKELVNYLSFIPALIAQPISTKFNVTSEWMGATFRKFV